MSLLDKESKVLVWSEEGGDRSLMFDVRRLETQRRAQRPDRLVGKLKTAMGY